MDSNMDNKFYVVEFIDPPTKDFEKYVCIPDTWAFVTNDDLVLIKYPLEKSSITKKRVKKREMYSDDWMVFEANIQFSTEVYRDAKNYIKVQKNILIQERSYAEVVDEECQPSTSGSSSYESEQNTSTAEINEPTTGPPLNHAESDQPTLTDTNLAIQKKPTEVNKTANSANQGKTYLTRQALRLTELQKLESLLPTHTDSKDQRKYYVTEDSEEEYNDFIESEDSEAYVIDESTDMSESDESASSSIDNVSEGTKELNDKVRHPLFQAEFIGLIKQLHSCLKQNSEKSKFLRPVYTIQSSMIECVLKSIENFNTSGDNKTLGVVTAGVNEIKIGGQIENIMVADSVQEAQAEEADKNLQKNKVDEDNTNKNTTPIPRGRLRKFTLPPEYDENDSRWTLRYRKKDKNLRELIPHSEIYVNKISLSTCKRLSKDSKTLARMLLLEIFTKNALSVCSLTGKKANAYNTDAIRPGLDKNARIVLLNYVEQHAQENKWVKLDTQSILNTLRNKMQDMRIQDGELFVLATRRKNKNKNNNDLL